MNEINGSGETEGEVSGWTTSEIDGKRYQYVGHFLVTPQTVAYKATVLDTTGAFQGEITGSLPPFVKSARPIVLSVIETIIGQRPA